MEGKLYFAYGSNINLDQMSHRCPDAVAVSPVTLAGYELLFRGNARGNGVATIAPKEGSTVHGLLWNITPQSERSLDLYEGFPHLYGKQSVTVQDKAGHKFQVMAYIMTENSKWQQPTMPSSYYFEGIWRGFEQNGLPTESLTQAWIHAAEEVDRHAVRINEQTSPWLKAEKKKGVHNER